VSQFLFISSLFKEKFCLGVFVIFFLTFTRESCLASTTFLTAIYLCTVIGRHIYCIVVVVRFSLVVKRKLMIKVHIANHGNILFYHCQVNSSSFRITNQISISLNSDVVTMALQMSPVDAHPENQPLCNFQPEAGAASAILSSGQVELPQCQLTMECSSSEQVPLPIVSLEFDFNIFQQHSDLKNNPFCFKKQNPVPPSPREVEQRVPARLVNEGATVVAGEELVLLMTSGEERCQGPEDGDIRGGAAPDFAVLSSDVSQLSVIVSSTVDAQADLSGLASTNQEGTHESTPCNPPSRQVDQAEVCFSSQQRAMWILGVIFINF
jgi:hypothetical protein